MKKFLVVLVASGALVFLILHFYYGSIYDSYNPLSIANSLFLIGLPLFFISIILITNLSELFVPLSFTFKKLFNRRTMASITLFDYKRERDTHNLTAVGIAALIVSSIYIAIALYISYTYF
ncbi:MAG: DUF3899 domain-containing protein [Candidatus Izemoplasmataceae bacterium]